MSNAEPLLIMENIEKSFPGVLALQGASLRVERGEVHALIGQNGAGKSTLLKILTGAYRRDAGQIFFDSQSVDFQTPHAAQNNGISTIYQEVNLIPFRSVSENIFMGRELRRWGWLNRKQMEAEARAILQRFEIEVDVTRPLLEYNVAIQQMVAIARTVSFKSKLIIMDEPTSSLDDHEVATLFKVIRQLKETGVAIIFVSHRLDELYAVCDQITIMRDGRTVGMNPMQSISKLELVAKMLGRDITEVRQAGQTGFQEKIQTVSEPILEAKNLQRGSKVRGVNLAVSPGEIVGLAGLLGSGRTEVARAIFGADEPENGEIKLGGKPKKFKSPRQAIKSGIGFCSEDRKTEGIIPYLSVRDNLTLALLPQLKKRGVISKEKQEAVVGNFITKLGIKTAGPNQKIRELSGGNQQKVLLARWLCLNPQLLILDEPTRGIDVGAKAEIQALISQLARDGLGVLMISSELEEITEGCNKVVVLREGQSVAELEAGQLNQEVVMAAMAHGEVTDSQDSGESREGRENK